MIIVFNILQYTIYYYDKPSINYYIMLYKQFFLRWIKALSLFILISPVSSLPYYRTRIGLIITVPNVAIYTPDSKLAETEDSNKSQDEQDINNQSSQDDSTIKLGNFKLFKDSIDKTNINVTLSFGNNYFFSRIYFIGYSNIQIKKAFSDAESKEAISYTDLEKVETFDGIKKVAVEEGTSWRQYLKYFGLEPRILIAYRIGDNTFLGTEIFRNSLLEYYDLCIVGGSKLFDAVIVEIVFYDIVTALTSNSNKGVSISIRVTVLEIIL